MITQYTFTLREVADAWDKNEHVTPRERGDVFTYTIAEHGVTGVEIMAITPSEKHQNQYAVDFADGTWEYYHAYDGVLITIVNDGE